DPDSVIFIVPDKVLNNLPFGALICPGSGRYFVEEFLFALSPSASVMAACTQRANEDVDVRDEKLLAVGNPSFDSARFAMLPELPSAAWEAESVARLYGSATKLTGREAQPGAVKARMQEANVIHFACHYVANERSPMLSSLLLSKEISG